MVKYSLHGDDVRLGSARVKDSTAQAHGVLLTAYAEPEPTFAIIVIMTCSFIENGPGFSATPKIFTLGTILAQTRMIGNDISCATIYAVVSIRWSPLRRTSLHR